MGSMENNHKILAKESEAFATAARVKYYDIVIDSGRGAILTDVDGNQYIVLPTPGIATRKLLRQFRIKQLKLFSIRQLILRIVKRHGWHRD